MYIGITGNLLQRMKYHKAGRTITTSRMPEFELVYYEACISKKDATERERQLKTGFGRGYLRKRMKHYLTRS